MSTTSSTRKLTVRSSDVKYEGTNKNGNAFTIYDVAVVGEDGEPIMEEFKSFDSLPIGELIEYEVEREDHEKYGVSYLLRLPAGVKAGPKPNSNAELALRVAKLESQVNTLTGASSDVPTSPALASPTMTTPVSDDDIPF